MQVKEMTAQAIQDSTGMTPQEAADFMRGGEQLHRDPNVAYAFAVQNDATGKWCWFFIAKTDTPNDIVNRYLRFVPEEAEAFIQAHQEFIGAMDDPMGMSHARLSRLVTAIPEKLHFALKQFDPDFFMDPKNIKALLQEFSYLDVSRGQKSRLVSASGGPS